MEPFRCFDLFFNVFNRLYFGLATWQSKEKTRDNPVLQLASEGKLKHWGGKNIFLANKMKRELRSDQWRELDLGVLLQIQCLRRTREGTIASAPSLYTTFMMSVF